MRELNEYPEWLDTPSGMYAADLASLLRRVLNKANITSGEIGCFRFGPEREDVVAANDRLRKQIENERDVTANVTAELATARENVFDLNQKLDTANAKVEILAAELNKTADVLGKEIDALQKKLDYKRERNIFLRNQLENDRDLQQKLNAANARIETLSSTVRAQEEEVDNLKSDLYSAERNQASLENKIETLVGDLTMSLRGQTALEDKLEYHRERNIFLRNQLDSRPTNDNKLLGDVAYTLRHDANTLNSVTESLRNLETKLRREMED